MEIRNMELNDIPRIVDLSVKHFYTDIRENGNFYKDILCSSNKFCLVAEDKDKKFLGFLEYAVLTQSELISMYPNSKLIFKPVDTKILYMSSVIVINQARSKGVASKLVNEAFKHGENAGCLKAIVFAVRDGVEGKVKAERILNKLKFQRVGEEVYDMWSQSAEPVNNCTVCAKVKETCTCSAIIYEKDIYTLQDLTSIMLGNTEMLYNKVFKNHIKDGHRMYASFREIENNDRYMSLILCSPRTGEVVAFGLGIVHNFFFGTSNPFCTVLGLCVKPELQEKGIGKFLINKIEELAKYRGCESVWLVSEDNCFNTQKFYEELGYSEYKKGFVKEI